MELKTLRCPNCDAGLEVEDDLDVFFCMYCGHRILLEGQSAAAYKAKTRVKEMAHKERLQKSKNEQERFKMEFKKKDERGAMAIFFGVLAALFMVVSIGLFVGEAGAQRQDEKLQSVVDQIMIDIENEDFASAYIKANTLYWDDSFTSEGEDKWNATRKEVIRQIEIAEKEAADRAGSQTDEESESFLSWLK